MQQIRYIKDAAIYTLLIAKGWAIDYFFSQCLENVNKSFISTNCNHAFPILCCKYHENIQYFRDLTFYWSYISALKTGILKRMCQKSFPLGERKKAVAQTFRFLKICFIKGANIFVNVYTSREMHHNGVIYGISSTWIIHQEGISQWNTKNSLNFPVLVQ